MPNPLLEWRNDVFLSTQVEVRLAAADWAILLTAMAQEGITPSIAYKISEQVEPRLFSNASRKATDAHFAEQHQQQFPFVVVHNHDPEEDDEDYYGPGPGAKG